MRIFVLLGQGGRLTSYGMVNLANRLSSLSDWILCTVHNWQDVQEVADKAKQTTDSKILLIGYSLGANSCTQIAAALPKRRFRLLVSYDASILQAGGIKPIGENVDKAICYRSTNYLLPWGHGQLIGKNVETYETPDNHLGVCWDNSLHEITIKAVTEILHDS